jgi:hypothetical protein
MSDPIKLPHTLPGTRAPYQKKATYQIAAVIDVSWPEGVPFDCATAARMAHNSLIQCREVNAAKSGIRWALVKVYGVDVTHCETIDMTEEMQ